MSLYLQWNDAIASHFFRPEMAGRPVHLFVNEEIVRKIGVSAGLAPETFVDAVKAGPPWVKREGLCQRALEAFDHWRERPLEYPPYVAFLGLFVLAAGTEGDFAKHAYYPRLRQLVGLTPDGQPPYFDRMLELWDDLEHWSTRNRNGELGTFVVTRFGKWIHVGVPVAQTVLTEDERRALPRLFAKAGLDPTSPLSDDALARAIRLNGAGLLRARTLDRIERQDADLYSVIIEVIADELTEWDGRLEQTETEADARVHGALRLCLSADAVAGRARAELRCRLKAEFPEDGLVLTGKGFPRPVICDEFLPGWSSALSEDESGRSLDAGTLDWRTGLALVEKKLKWRLHLPGASVRLMVKGARDGLPGLVEVHRLPKEGKAYVLFHQEAWPRLRQWSEEECQGFRDLEITVGLPPGWHLASVDRVLGDEHVRKSFPLLAYSDSVRILFRNGIRSAAGSNFFSFARPIVEVEGGRPQDEIRCSGQLLRPQADGLYRLPASLPVEVRIGVEVVRAGEIVRSQSLYLTGDFDWQQTGSEQLFDCWGDVAESPQPSVAGALVSGATELPFHPDPALANGLHPSEDRILFLGRRPSEAVLWPSEGLTSAWQPIWAIQGRKRMKSVYCGTAIEESTPLDEPTASRLARRAWKEVLWHRRKRISEPQHPLARRLWRAYQEAARNA